MNTISKTMMWTMLTLALGLSACAKKDESSSRVVNRAAGTGVAQGIPHTCTDNNMVVGKIFDPTASGNFEAQVKAFVSATLNPEEIGSISGNIADKTGIDLIGSFQFDSQGKLIVGSSRVTIKIVDSFVGQIYNGSTLQPYLVEFATANEGHIDRTMRQFQVKFKDSYGEIVFQGSYDNQFVQGTVYFTNNSSVNGQAGASGTLGSFKSYTCGLIK